MKRLVLLFALIAASAAAAPAATDTSHDPHKLSAEELHAFLPAVCKNGKKTKTGFDCAELPGYPSDGAAFNENTRKASGEINLDAVAYGGFAAKGADEAYVTYSGLEPHAQNFGGGILLRRAVGSWKPVRWVPGGQMDHCVALLDGPQKMLCLTGYTGMGETDSSVWLLDLSALEHGGSIKRTSILKAQDGREASADGTNTYYCDHAVASHRDMLLSIDDLTRSHENGVLAVSKITTTSATDARDACGSSQFPDVVTHDGVVRYRVAPGGVKVDPPPRFAPVDY